jgi:hypothetical protein
VIEARIHKSTIGAQELLRELEQVLVVECDHDGGHNLGSMNLLIMLGPG